MLDDLLRVLTFQAGFNTSVVLLGAACLGAAAGMAGVFPMLRGRALVADALAHGTLPGIAGAFLIAALLGHSARDPLWLMAGALIAAGLSLGAIEWLGRTPRVGADAATAAVLATAFGLGLALLSIVQTLTIGGQAGLEQLLFGAAAAMLPGEAMLMAFIAVAIMLAVLLTLKELSASAFDPDFARASGLPTGRLDALSAGLSAMVVVAALPIAGFVLAIALLVIPPAAARFWTNRSGNLVLISGAFGALAASIGAGLSRILADLPTGPAIVLAAAVLFTLSLVFGSARGLARVAAR